MKRPKRVSIVDVAKHTGLAVSTVSNALRGHQHVKESTRARVQDVAKRLGYRASPLAQALRSGRSSAIGVLVPDISNPAYPDIVRGIEDAAADAGRAIVLCNADGDDAKQLRALQWLLDSGIDGLILVSQNCSAKQVRALLKQASTYVLVQRYAPGFNDDYVGSDNTSIIRAAIEHLCDLGHTRIGYARGPRSSSSVQERVAVFEAELRRRGLSAEPAMIYEGEHTVNSGFDAGKYFLGLRNPPTAVIANCDVNAIGVIQAAIDLGYTVPGDLSVVGVDDIDLARLRQINLTTVRQERRTIGVQAVNLLTARLQNPRGRPRRVIVPTTLIVRGTTAVPGVRLARDCKFARNSDPL